MPTSPSCAQDFSGSQGTVITSLHFYRNLAMDPISYGDYPWLKCYKTLWPNGTIRKLLRNFVVNMVPY
jgi:hypothetical protein